MASRMDRYRNQKVDSKRSVRNAELYKTIYEDSTYSNIEGIATIEKTNEVDINKIKAMLENREKYQKEKQYRQILNNEEEEKKEEKIVEVPIFEDEDKNYDIRDILNKAKDERKDDSLNDYHSIEEKQFEIVNKLKAKKLENEYDDPTEIKELLDTMTDNEELKKLDDSDLSLDLLDDLKPSENTIHGDDAIDKLLNEVNSAEKKIEISDDTTEIDKSFYTASMNFKAEDFEDLKDINKNLKKNNSLIKSLLGTIFIIVLIIVSILVYQYLIK